MKMLNRMTFVAAIFFFLAGTFEVMAAEKISFYFATSVQGALAKKMTKMVDQYNDSQNEVEVVASFTGSYAETKTKASAAVRAGKPPEISMMSANLIHEFVAEDQVEAIENFLGETTQAEFLNDFWPGVHANASVNGKLYAIPLQNSTPLLFINADHFREVGLDPNNPPSNWDELVDVGKKLIKKDGDKTIRYGLMMPQQAHYGTWIMQAFVMANGGQWFNSEYPGEVYYDSSAARGTLQFYSDLAHEYGIIPASVTHSSQVSTDFFSGRTSMMIVSTGALGNVRENASFDYRVGFVPGNVRNAVPVGGASVMIFKGLTPEKRAAAWKFASWLTSAEQLGSWSRATGYFSPRKSSYDLPVMKAFMVKHPDAGVALDQLQFTKPWYGTYKTFAVDIPMSDAMQAVVSGKKSVDEAATEAQAKAVALLKPYNKALGYTQK